MRIISTVWLESRYAARQLIRARAFSATAIFILALGIGTTTGIFAVLDGAILKPLPYPNSSALVRVELLDEHLGLVANPSETITKQLSGRAGPIGDFALINLMLSHVTGHGEPEEALAASVTPSFFSVLGVRPKIGRPFAPGDSHRQVAVLSYGLWRERFAGDAGAIGANLIVDDAPFTVVGVMPRGFEYPKGVRLWVAGDPANPEAPGYLAPYQTIARMRPGVSVDAAQAAGALVGGRVLPAHDIARYRLRIVSLRDTLVPSYASVLWLLFGAVAFVLLIACANVANLLLSRASGRRREVAVRVSLGCPKLRLITELLVEGVLLAVAAAALGTVVASWAIAAFRALAPEPFVVPTQISLDRRALAFALVASVASSLVFSFWPAIRMAKPELQQDLKDAEMTATMHKSRLSAARCLLIVQVALSTTLSIGAGLALLSLWNLTRIDTGFEEDHVIVARLTPLAEYRDSGKRLAFYGGVLERVRTVSGVRFAAGVDAAPLNNRQALPRKSVVGDAALNSVVTGVRFNIISPEYFQTLGIPVIAGRDFSESDGADTVIVNQTLARRLWPNSDAIGHRLAYGSLPSNVPFPSQTVVAVVKDSREDLKHAPEPEIYIPLSELPAASLFLVIRTTASPEAILGSIKAAIWAVDPDQPLSNIKTARDLRSESISLERLTTILLGSFGLLSAILTILGLTSFILYWASQRRFEFGLRSALGADPATLTKMGVMQIVPAVVVGTTLGLGMALALAGLLRHMLFDVSPRAPSLYVGAVALELSITLLAAYIPARRAGQADPASVLRQE